MAPQPEITAAMERLIAERVAEAIAEYEANRASGSGTARNEAPQEPAARGCSYKEFLSCKPTEFKGTEGAVGLFRWFEKLESVFRICNCPEDSKVKYSICMLSESALTWWNSQAQSMGMEAAYALRWEYLKQIMQDEYCPRNEIQKLEAEFWELKVVDNDVTRYTNRFLELAILCPTMVTPEYKKVERYIWGLSPQIQGLVTSSQPGSIQKAIRMAHNLNDQIIRQRDKVKTTEDDTDNGKRKAQCLEDVIYAVPINSYPPINQHLNRRTYKGNKPRCITCQYHHPSDIPCRQCTSCGRYGHLSNTCRSNSQTKRTDIIPHHANGLACYICGDPNHFRKNCPKFNNLKAIQNSADGNEA